MSDPSIIDDIKTAAHGLGYAGDEGELKALLCRAHYEIRYERGYKNGYLILLVATHAALAAFLLFGSTP